jgi:hypothetical protein
MEELLIAPPTTAIAEPEPSTQHLYPRHNHLLQGLLAFLAVVGIGATITVLISPPVTVRVVTIERESARTIDRDKPPEIHYVERVVEKAPVLLPPAQRPKRGSLPPPQPQKPHVMPNSADCHDDPLCGIDNSKQ